LTKKKTPMRRASFSKNVVWFQNI